MAFMRKKLEEQYQNKLDEMEAELDEARDESEAQRLQMKSLIEHVEQSGGTALAAAELAAAAAAGGAEGDTRHVEKLKKELAKQGDQLRKYEAELSKIRTNEILPAAADCAAAAAGVAELQNQLTASQAEVATLRSSVGLGRGRGGDMVGLQAEVARLSQELRVAKMQAAPSAAASAAAAAPTAAAAGGAPGGKMADLMAMRNGLAATLAKSNEAAEARAKGTGSWSSSPVENAGSPPAMAGSDTGPALTAAQAEVAAAKAALATAAAQWEHEKSEWLEKEEKWKAETAQFKAGLGAEAQEAVATLDAERTKWEQEQQDWQAKEAQWAAESEQ